MVSRPVPALARLRLLWRNVHLWIGVGLFVAILPLSATGAVLVWRDAMERMLEPQRFAASDGPARLPASAYLAAGEQALEGRATVTQVRFPGSDGGPVVVSGRPTGGGRGNVSVWLDPQTAAVRDIGAARGAFHQGMHQLHGSLMIPQVGRKIVGWVGWAMTVSALTGLWLWWPLRGGLARAFRWSRGSGTLYNLHHLMGFWICLPLLLLSLTGVYLSFPQTSRALFGVGEPARPEAQRAPGGAGSGAASGQRREGGPRGQGGGPLENPQLTAERAAMRALAAAPGSTLVSITLPNAGRDPTWRVQVRPRDDAEPRTLTVNDATGEARIASRGPGVQDPLSRWMRRLHDGANLPFAFKLLITIGGIAPVILAITGVIMWLQRRGRTAPERATSPRPIAAE